MHNEKEENYTGVQLLEGGGFITFGGREGQT